MLRAVGTLIIGILLCVPLSMILLVIPAYYLLPFTVGGTIWFRHYRKKPASKSKSNSAMPERCSQCGTLQEGNWSFCEQCGAPRDAIASMSMVSAHSRGRSITGKLVAIAAVVVFALLALMMYRINQDPAEFTQNDSDINPKVQQIATESSGIEGPEARRTPKSNNDSGGT